MKTLLPLNEVFDSEYLLFHVVEKPFNFVLETLVVDEYVLLDENYYDFFDSGNYVIIGFKNINGQFLPPTSSVFVTRIKRESGETHIIQMEDFSNILEIFGIVNPRSSYLYWVMDSLIISNVFDGKTYSAVPAKNRCDVDNPSFGPWRFEVRDGVYETSYDYEKIPKSAFFTTARVLSAPTNGHIVRLSITGDIDGWHNQPITTVAGTSFTEALQIMRHWSMIYNADTSIDERIAIQCNKFDKFLNFSDEIINELDMYCPTTSVSRYFSGLENSRDRQNAPVEAGNELKKYLAKHYCYPTLSSLFKYSNVQLTIDEEILRRDFENISIKLMVFLENNQIQHSEKSVFDLLNELTNEIDSGNWSSFDRKYEQVLLRYIASM